MNELIDLYKQFGYALNIDTKYLVANAVRIESKARIPRPLFNYRFRSLEKMNNFCQEWINEKRQEAEAKKNKKSLLAQAAKSEHPYKVGQIIYNSWGWEQTNIDFYQVVEVKPKSIKIRAITSAYAKDQKCCGSMSAYVVPVKDDFKDEPQIKRVLLYLSSTDNTPTFYIKAKYGSYSIYDQGDAGLYSSWYA